VSGPAVAGVRSGEDYRASLADGRAVYVDGERVDVTLHPAFTGVINSVASLFDMACDPDLDMVVDHPAVGGPANRIYLTPRSQQDLVERRRAITAMAERSCGFIGRGPDHVAAFFAGFAAYSEIFDRSRALGSNVVAFHRRMARQSLYCSYCIIPPSVDRAIAAEGGSELQQVQVVAERDDGIVVRGSQILGTGTAISDHLFVSCIAPLREGQERFAVSFVVPVATSGLRIHCRRPYAAMATSVWDYPLMARFDETDAMVAFDDVMVPWDDVFVCGDVDLVRRQFHGTAAHTLGNTQAQIRLAVKLKFLVGLAVKIVAVSGGGSPEAQDQLAELVALAAQVEGMVLASEYCATIDDHGVAIPDRRYLYGAMALQAEVYPRAIQLLRLLSSSQIINLPSSRRALDSEERVDLLAHATSPRTAGEDRIKLFRLAWDVIGSEFGSRHEQYEMFYAGAPAVAKNYARQHYRLDEATGLVDRFFAGYG
jgi:4-hydroxyphenylacetate 3-monooxygenase